MDVYKILMPEGVELSGDEEFVDATAVELTDNKGDDDE